jgi:hypothetical protein
MSASALISTMLRNVLLACLPGYAEYMREMPRFLPRLRCW